MEVEIMDCADCKGNGYLLVLDRATMVKMALGEISLAPQPRLYRGESTRVPTWEIMSGTLTVACPSCELGQWKLRNNDGLEDHQFFHRGMIVVSDLSDDWFDWARRECQAQCGQPVTAGGLNE